MTTTIATTLKSEKSATKPANGTAKPAASPGATYQLLPLAQVDPPPWNPRKKFDKAADAELAASVKEFGVQQPVKARPRPAGRFELVYGERRYRAAKACGLTTIPAMVEELTDQQVAVLQAIENGQRRDVHALEEAETYRRMRELHGMAPEAIAAAIGKGRTWVYDRLRLCNLAPAPRTACLQGALEVSTAFLLSRYPKPVQGEVWTLLQRQSRTPGPGRDGGAMSYRDVQELLRRDFQVDLKAAPFAVSDAQLVPAAGPCTSCPKRTGNARDDYPVADIQSPDVCTDRGCYRQKLERANAQRMAEHQAAGGRVLPAKEAARIFPEYNPTSLECNAPYRELDSTHYGPNGKSKTYRQLLAGTAHQVVLARDRKGQLHELVDKKFADKAVQAANRQQQQRTREQRTAESQRAESTQQRAARERQRREQAFRERLGRALAAAVASAAGKAKLIPDGAWRALLEQLLETADEAIVDVTRRRGMVPEGTGEDDFTAHELAMQRASEKGDSALLRALIFELVALGLSYSYDQAGLERLASGFGVDPKAVRKELAATVQAELKAAKLAPPGAAPGAGPGRPPRASAKGGRR